MPYSNKGAFWRAYVEAPLITISAAKHVTHFDPATAEKGGYGEFWWYVRVGDERVAAKEGEGRIGGGIRDGIVPVDVYVGWNAGVDTSKTGKTHTVGEAKIQLVYNKLLTLGRSQQTIGPLLVTINECPILEILRAYGDTDPHGIALIRCEERYREVQ